MQVLPPVRLQPLWETGFYCYRFWSDDVRPDCDGAGMSFDIDEIEAEIARDKRRVKLLAWGIIILLFFLVCTTCCDPNGDLPPQAKPVRGGNTNEPL